MVQETNRVLQRKCTSQKLH